MIVFDLRCAQDHVFEAWFASTHAYEDQRARSLLVCPVCGDTGVAKALMAPNVAAKGNAVSRPERIKAMLGEIAAAQGKALEGSRWVGRRFADEARAIHAGEAAEETIHGQATPEEARALIDEGVPVAPLLLPVAPPDTLN